MFNLLVCMENKYCLMLLHTVLFYLKDLLFVYAKLCNFLSESEDVRRVCRRLGVCEFRTIKII